MANEPKKNPTTPTYKRRFKPVDQPEEKDSNLLAALVRATGENFRPIAATGTRLLGGIGATPGGWIGAGVAGAAEALAQKFEGKEDLSIPRIGVEAAIGAVPFAKTIQAGKAGLSALKSGAMGLAGVLGRKGADVVSGEDKDALKKWSGWDAAGIGAGAAMGGVMGKISKGAGSADAAKTARTLEQVAADTAAGKPIKRVTLEDVLKSKKYKPEDIDASAGRAEALVGTGHPKEGRDLASGLRVAAVKTNSGNPKIHADLVKGREADIAQTAKNLNARDKFKFEVEKAATKQAAQAALAREKAWIQEAKNLSANEKQEALDAAAVLVKARELQIAQAGGKSERVLTKSVSSIDPKTGEKMTSTEKIAKPRGRKGPGGAKATPPPTQGPPVDTPAGPPPAGVPPVTPVTPAPKKTAPTTPPAAPVDPVVPTTVPPVPVPTKGKGSKTAAKTPPVAPVTPLVEPVVPGKGGVATLPPDPPPARPAAPVTPTGPKPKGPKTPPPAAAPATGAPKSARAAKAGKVAQTPSTTAPAPPPDVPVAPVTPPVTPPVDTPVAAPAAPVTPVAPIAVPPTPDPGVGQTFARFFRTPEGPAIADKFRAEQPQDVGKAMDNLLAQYEAHTKAGRKAKNLGGKVQAASRNFGFQSTKAAGKGSTTAGTQAAAPIAPVPGPVAPPPAGPQTGPVAPAAPVVSDLPAIVPGKPVPPELQSRIDEFRKLRDTITADTTMPPAQKAAIEKTLAENANALQTELAALEVGGAAGMLAGKKPPPKGPKGSGPKGGKTAPVPPAEPPPPTVAKPTPEQLKPRLSKDKKPSGSGGTSIGMALGGGQDVMDIIARNPEFATNLIGGALGAGTGAVMNDEDPLSGAIVGGAAGAGLAHGARTLATSPTAMDDIKHFAKSIPNMQRAALLSDPLGLPINTIAAPWGAGIMGSIERMLTGAAERVMPNQQVTGALDEGLGGLKNLANPMHVKRIGPSFREAKDMLHGVNERGEQLMGDATTLWDKFLSLPSTVMATGDLATRKGLTDAGMTEDMARAMTLTANPRSAAGEKITEWAKASPLLAMLQPFSRTAVNVVESGLERAPIIGAILSNMHPNFQASVAEIVARQGQSAGVAYMAYQMGASVDPDTAASYQVPKLVSNMAGQYGSIAAAAFAAGMASQKGRDPGPAALTSVLRDVPLPAGQLVEDLGKSALNYAKGEPAHPNAEHLPQRWLPNAMLPGFAKDKNIELYQENIPDIMPTYKRRFNGRAN